MKSVPKGSVQNIEVLEYRYLGVLADPSETTNALKNSDKRDSASSSNSHTSNSKRWVYVLQLDEGQSEGSVDATATLPGS